MMNESKMLVEEVEEKNRALESECQTLGEKLKRTLAQSDEMKGLMELYKEKYKTEKLGNRQGVSFSERQ